MKTGPSRFEYYLAKLELLLQQASKDPSPAMYLFRNDARTPLFMLEALARIYRTIHNENKFKELKDDFKSLEDALGAIDYYTAYAAEFKAHPSVPVEVRQYIEVKVAEAIASMNVLLVARGWLEEDGRVPSIRRKLAKADWKKPKSELQAIQRLYETSISKINKFIRKNEEGFTDIENQVHELRRELRWLSIYPQAMKGAIQTMDNGEDKETLLKYFTPAITNSPFNVMPDAGDNEWFLLLEKNYFYALSWMIAELGRIKDDGLQFFAAAEALQHLEGLSQKKAFEKSFAVFGSDRQLYHNLLSEASSFANQFCDDKVLDNLLLGVTYIKKLDPL